MLEVSQESKPLLGSSITRPGWRYYSWYAQEVIKVSARGLLDEELDKCHREVQAESSGDQLLLTEYTPNAICHGQGISSRS